MGESTKEDVLKEKAPKKIKDLVEIFEKNISAFKSHGYNEQQLRQDFINPFFEALGWEVSYKGGVSPNLRDVIHEDSIKMASGGIKAPDYCFTKSGTKMFFVEAKKPSVDIKKDPYPAFQLRSYAWSADLSVSILTNFEVLAIYESRKKPKETDKANTELLKSYTYKQYVENWSEIANIFSKKAVYDGSLDRFAQSVKSKHGTQDVGDEFLKEIEGWREILARNIAIRNPTLSSVHELNYSVQSTIDRIIFLRMCEDRGIEKYGQLRDLLMNDNIYENLCKIYLQSDEKYNSGLFHFKKEKGRSTPPDDITLKVSIDDNVLSDIIKHIYPPESPYQFSVFKPEILGNVYEQFLGKIIHLTEGHRAKIEEKPETKKAGGIYYTPEYVVDYIVKNTVGKFCEGKTPKQIEKLHILDPACGSGSFLLGAYSYLLKYILDYYSKRKNPQSYKDQIYQGKDGQWFLTTKEKKRILLNNIYGIDIDSQAVEVTKLSLLLKVLEGENRDIREWQKKLWAERVLPDLGNNIKCGNTLIGPDFYTDGQTKLFENGEMYRINAFDWYAEFAEIMNGGGFDVVIGNPPYRRERDFKFLMDEIANTKFGKKFRAPRMDLWYYFVHRGLQLLKINGRLSFITNSYWTNSTGAIKLIGDIKENAYLEEIFFFDKLKVFKKVTGQHMIFCLSKSIIKKPTVIKLVQPNEETTAEPFVTGYANVKIFKKQMNQLFHDNKVDLQPPSDKTILKIEQWPTLDTLGIIRQGIAENPASINQKTNEKFGNQFKVGQGVFVLNYTEMMQLKLPNEEKDVIRPYYALSDLDRYYITSKPSLFLIYSTRSTYPDINKYPKIRNHLIQFKSIMEKRRETMKGSNSWWHLHWPRDEKIWLSPKILSVQMGLRPVFVPTSHLAYVSFSVNVFVPYDTTKEHLNYFTGLLNSKLMWKWYKHNAKRRGVGLEINCNVLERTPIRTIDFSDRSDKIKHDKMVQLVDQILELHNKLPKGKTEHEKTLLQRQIDATDYQIDQLVYDLYGLTKEEIAIVEESLK